MKILNMLTPTNNENANKWREACRQYHASKKSPNNFKNLPDGTRIGWYIPYETNHFAKGTYLVLRKGRLNPLKKRSHYVWHIEGTSYYVTPNMVDENDYIII